jgi:hypothetical protein
VEGRRSSQDIRRPSWRKHFLSSRWHRDRGRRAVRREGSSVNSDQFRCVDAVGTKPSSEPAVRERRRPRHSS